MTKNEEEGVLPFGPVDYNAVVSDTFTYEEVKENHCVAQIANDVCRHLLDTAQSEGKKFLTVCCPAYNEEAEEMQKTIYSMLQSFHFMKTQVR
jgi:hypothetical protein